MTNKKAQDAGSSGRPANLRRRSKTSLPPRIRVAWDRNPHVEKLKDIDFASPAAVEALEAAGWNWAAEALMRDAEWRGVELKWLDALRQAPAACTGRPIFMGDGDEDSGDLLSDDSALVETAAAQLGTTTDVIAEKNLMDHEGEMLALHNEIRNAAIDYAENIQHQVAPHIFKGQATAFRNAVKSFEAKLSKVAGQPCVRAHFDGSELAEAINCELERLGYEDVPDIESIHHGISILCEAVDCVVESETGQGRQPNRAKHQFVTELVDIFEKRTRTIISRGVGGFDDSEAARTKPNGHFFAFVMAVDELLPDDMRLGSDWAVDHLISSRVSNAKQR